MLFWFVCAIVIVFVVAFGVCCVWERVDCYWTLVCYGCLLDLLWFMVFLIVGCLHCLCWVSVAWIQLVVFALWIFGCLWWLVFYVCVFFVGFVGVIGFDYLVLPVYLWFGFIRWLVWLWLFACWIVFKLICCLMIGCYLALGVLNWCVNLDWLCLCCLCCWLCCLLMLCLDYEFITFVCVEFVVWLFIIRRCFLGFDYLPDLFDVCILIVCILNGFNFGVFGVFLIFNWLLWISDFFILVIYVV